jgi:hypothetical protein
VIGLERLGVGDPSVEPHAVHLCERLVETGSVVLRTLSGTRAGEVATQRWLSSPRVTIVAIVKRRVFAGPFVWVWTGDHALSAAGPPPPALDWATDPERVTATGTMDVACIYLALKENALDLSHFVHAPKQFKIKKVPKEIQDLGF